MKRINSILIKYKYMPIQMRASIWFLVCSFFQKGISLITTPIFTRILTTEEYGQYNVFNSWLGIVAVFVSLNLYQGVYAQGLVRFTDDRKEFSSSMQGLTLTCVAIWAVIYFIFRDFWNSLLSLTTTQMIAMLSIIWTTAVYNFWASEKRVVYSYTKLVCLTVCVCIFKPLLSIILIKISSDKVTARILGIALVELIAYTGLFVVQMKNGKKFFKQYYWRYALAYNLPLIPHYLSSTILNSSDRIMIGRMVGDSSAGIYGLAYSISQIMIVFNTALNQTMTPWIYQKIRDKKSEDISGVAIATLVIVAIVNLATIAAAPEVIAIFAPTTYGSAIWMVPPIVMSVFFIYMYDLFSKFSFYFEKTKFIASATVIGAILNVVLNFLFVPIFGAVAAAYTTLVCYMMFAGLHYLAMKKCLKKEENICEPFNKRELLVIASGFVGTAFIIMATYPYPVIRYTAIIAAVITLLMRRKTIVKMIESIIRIRK